MTSPKQDKRPKTLIEYMGFKDPDLNEYSHDEWCLKLLNPKIIERMVRKKEFGGEPENTPYGQKLTFYEYIKKEYQGMDVGWIDIKKYHQNKDIKGDYLSLTDNVYENIEPYRIRKIIIKTLELEHVLVKHGFNGYSQRLGFLDVFCSIILEDRHFIKINGEEVLYQHNEKNGKKIELFFEVKTSKQTIGSIAREIEYYRQALYEIHGNNIIPILIAKERLPITQFETITFEEILQMEKELE